MDGIANVARQQQSQMSTKETNAQVSEPTVSQTIKQQNQDIKNEVASGVNDKANKIQNADDVKDLVDQLNDALSPISTSLKFGVDTDDIFYVSVIESESNKMIRRFPAEEAMDFLPKMKEVSGILFDTKG